MNDIFGNNKAYALTGLGNNLIPSHRALPYANALTLTGLGFSLIDYKRF
jgi:hypothetical protein